MSDLGGDHRAHHRAHDHPAHDHPAYDEGVLDPWVEGWLGENPMHAMTLEEMTPEILQLARGPALAPPTLPMATVTDELVGEVPVRVYEPAGTPTGLVVYFHGGGFIIGSVGLMDNVARQLAHASGAVVVSVEYRWAPEHPYPAALDDCEEVTRWAFAHTGRFGLPTGSVAVAGESAGGNLAAALSLRLRDRGGPAPATQVLIYPAVAGGEVHPSQEAFDGLVISRAAAAQYWGAYCGGRDLNADPYAAPLHAGSLRGLPPRWCCSAGATCCGTRAGPTPGAWWPTAW